MPGKWCRWLASVIRVVLVQRMCIAKTTEMYFSAEEARHPCGAGILTLPNFWAWHKSGDLNAKICNNHAAMVLRGHGYLSEQVQLAMDNELRGNT